MKQTGNFWIDETGSQIPANRITKLEKLQEKYAHSILTAAQKANKQLTELKEEVETVSKSIYEELLYANNIEKASRKGNFTWFSFDRTIKIEYSINDKIVFDESLISLCREKLSSFLEGSITGTEEFVKELVMDAFETRNNGLDTKKVMNLLKYRSRIKNILYQEAMDLLEKSIRKPESKAYTRVFVKNVDGKYEVVQLNFSAL